jgi:hypothetical protein
MSPPESVDGCSAEFEGFDTQQATGTCKSVFQMLTSEGFDVDSRGEAVVSVVKLEDTDA